MYLVESEITRIYKESRKAFYAFLLFLFSYNYTFAISPLPIDSMHYYLNQLNQRKDHDSLLVVKAMTIIDVKILSDEQFSKADSIVEHYKAKLRVEFYYAFKYDLNFGLVMANKYKKAFERITNDITFLKSNICFESSEILQ